MSDTTALVHTRRCVVLDHLLELPTSLGTTRCHVRATTAADGSLPVVLVEECGDGAGPSAYLLFPSVACAVRRLLPGMAEEPVWVHRWAERALASVLLHDEVIASDHVMRLAPGGWQCWPVSRALTGLLLG